MRLAWATDIHLNFLSSVQVDGFCDELSAEDPDAYVITGDISDAPALERHLNYLASKLGRPIYFVLGNHDYYHGSIERVRTQLACWTADQELLRWLPQIGVVPLSEDTALVGHGGWGDAILGDGRGSRVRLNDATMIEELACLSHLESLPLLAQLGRDAADCLRPHLLEAVAHFEHVVVATHVPPFREACWHMGELSDDSWSPFFTWGAMGALLSTTFKNAPQCRGTVLCGHTHSSGTAKILPNLEVLTGAAKYGSPGLVTVLEL